MLYLSDEVRSWLSSSRPERKPSQQSYYGEDIGLQNKFKELKERLGGGISALDVEKVAYVLIKEGDKRRAESQEKRKEKIARDGPVISEKVQILLKEAGTFVGELEEEKDTKDVDSRRRSKRRKT